MTAASMQVRQLIFQSVPVKKRQTPIYHLLPGGPVPRVGVTITMTDELLNGTNRVVLDGVMTEKECDRILQLAKVCWGSGDQSNLALKKKPTTTQYFVLFSQSAASAGDGYRGRRSPHTPHETLEGLSVLRAAKVSSYLYLHRSVM